MRGPTLVAFLLFSCVVGGRAENLAALITDTRVLTRDAASTTRQRFSDAQYTELLNQGQREAISATHCLAASLSFSLAVGTTYYPLPSNFVSATRVVRSRYGALQEKSPASLDAMSRGWEVASGSPNWYFINFSSRGLIGFATFPSTTTDIDVVKVEYWSQPNDMVNSTDVPFNGASEMYDYHHALAYFAASMAYTIDGLNNQAAAFMGIFTNQVGVMKSRCMDRPNYLPSASASP